MIELYEKKIGNDPRLHRALWEVLRDRYIYRVLKEFFKDGGRLEAWQWGGHYDHEKKIISVGLACQKDDICLPEFVSEATLAHELLHYIFDKTDSALFESESAGGADHDAIRPLEERFIFLHLIASGKPPIDQSVSGLYGFTKAGKLADTIESLLRENDLEKLKSFFESDDFYTNYVHSGMTGVLSFNKYAKENPDKISYVYSSDQIQDITHLWAFNAAILGQAFRLATALARRHKISWEQAFARDDFQEAFSQFLRAFAVNLQVDPSLSLRKTSKNLMAAAVITQNKLLRR